MEPWVTPAASTGLDVGMAPNRHALRPSPGDTAVPKLTLQQAMPRSHPAAGAREATGAEGPNGSALEAEPGLVPVGGNDLLWPSSWAHRTLLHKSAHPP